MDKQIGPYNVVRLIGTGGMGSVYEVLHSQLQRRAAIKVLHKEFQKDAEFLQRFFNEARTVNLISHPSVVSVYDFGSATDGSPYIVMEYLEGESLRQRMTRSGRLAPDNVMRIGKHVASGLASAHAKHVVHRDLKPVNIMLIPDADSADGERAKILDFGIAKQTSNQSAKALTRVGATLGTPAYMSPEQCRSASDVSDRSDVYSFGVILFEMLANEHPFADARADSAMMASHIGRPPPPLDGKAPGAGGDLVALVHRMLAKQPDARPSAAEVAAVLSRLTGSATGLIQIIQPPLEGSAPALSAPAVSAMLQPDAGGSPRWPRWLAGGKLVVVGAATALLLGVLGLVWVGRALLNPPPPPPPEQVHWALGSEPAGAEVVDAVGQVLGKTPLQLTRVRASGVQVLSVRLAGYSEQRVPLDADKNAARSVVLTALPAPPPPPPEPPAIEEGRAKGKHRKHAAKPAQSKSPKKRHHRAP